MRRHLPLGLFSLFTAVSLFTAACGSVAPDAKDGPKGSPGTTPPVEIETPKKTAAPLTSCTRERTAPLVAIDDVDNGLVKVGPCGDIAYAKRDRSLWLRTVDGVTTKLADYGHLGEFDATGTYLAYETGLMGKSSGVLRELRAGTEATFPLTPSFGVDRETGKPIVYLCGGAVRIVKDGVAGDPIPGTTGFVCHETARYGSSALLLDLELQNPVVVDLVRGAALPLNVGFAGRGLDSSSHRADRIRLSPDGAVVLYQAVTWTPCGDTECNDNNGFVVLDAKTGKETQSVTERLDIELFDFDGFRGHALRVRSSADTLDTATGTFVDRSNASIVQVQRDGTLVLAQVAGGDMRISLAAPNEPAGTPWFSLSGYEAKTIAWPEGRASITVEPTTSVKTPSGSNWGGSYYGDLIVRDDAQKELARRPWVTDATALTFAPDGSAVVTLTHYASTPPAVADSSSDLGLVVTIARIGRDGTMLTLSDDADAWPEAIAIDERSVVLVDREGARIHDLTTGALRSSISEPRLFVVRSPWPEPLPVVALEGDQKLWHGVADR